MKIKKLSIFSLFISLALVSTFFSGCGQKTTNLTKVKLNEVVRSIFYAPMYAAITQGYFKEEGLDIDLTTGQGADATITKPQV